MASFITVVTVLYIKKGADLKITILIIKKKFQTEQNQLKVFLNKAFIKWVHRPDLIFILIKFHWINLDRFLTNEKPERQPQARPFPKVYKALETRLVKFMP